MGIMKAQEAQNPDMIPYQLRSENGSSGKIWGNAVTASDVGNGVNGVGNGKAQTHIIYATMPSADYRQGKYQDTVTVYVYY